MAADQQSTDASVASSGRSLRRRLALVLPRSSERVSCDFGNRLAPNPSGLSHSRQPRAIKSTAGSRSIPKEASSLFPVAARFYDTATGESLGGLHGHDRPTTDVAFSPNVATIATADTGGTLRLWEFTSWSPRAVIKAHDNFIFRLAFHPGGTMLASASDDSSVRIWETASGKLLTSFKHPGQVYGLSFNPDGTRLATACRDNTIRLWDVARFEEVAQVPGHQAYVHTIAFSADGTRLVSCCGDFTIRIWDAPKSASILISILGSPPVLEALSTR